MNDLEFDILLPAFFAGLLVLSTHIPLGIRVLQRGVIFADLAVAQIAGLGVIVAGLLGLTAQPLLVQLVAAASALCGAVLLNQIEQRVPEVKEACIGLTFVLSATLGILLLSRDVHAGEYLQNLLVGQVLWVSQGQLVATVLLSAFLLAAWRNVQRSHNQQYFYVLLALAVTASVQLVGIYLVFASLIIPALTTWRHGKRRYHFAFATGVGGYALGLLFSICFDLPAGAAIVWAMMLCGGAVLLSTRS